MIFIFLNVLVGRKMATSKDIKRTFKRYFVIITIIITKVAASGFRIGLRSPTENQIPKSYFAILAQWSTN
jgi:hypothetical protein